MPNWVLLKDLMENPSKYGVEDPRLLEIAYTPDKQSITLTKDMTGEYEEQTFKTETEGHKYYPVMHEWKLYLVSSTVTNERLVLSREIGSLFGAEALKEHSKLYSNNELEAKGETWNEVTIKILDVLPKYLRRVGGYWTTIYGPKSYYLRLKRVFKDCMGYNYIYDWLTNARDTETYSYAVRPLVSLPSNIQVDIEKIDGTPLSLRLPKKQAEEQEAQLDKTAKKPTSDLIEKLKSNMAKMSSLMEETKDILDQIAQQNLT